MLGERMGFARQKRHVRRRNYLHRDTKLLQTYSLDALGSVVANRGVVFFCIYARFFEPSRVMCLQPLSDVRYCGCCAPTALSHCE